MSDTKTLSILLRALGATQTARDVGQVDSSISRLTSRAGSFASTLKGGVGTALTTFGGRLKQAAFGIAAFAGIGGILGLSGALEKSIGKAQDWGLAIEKLGPITGSTAEQLSGLLAVTEKFGIDTERFTKLAGFEAKAIEALALKSKGAAKFQADYGFSILDSSGKVKDFSTLLLTFSDYYKSNTNAAQKNAAAAKLFGRSYTDLIPVLNLGAQGIRDAEAEAKALGLTLTQDNVGALAKAREATRKWSDAIGGLELQIGLNLLPALSDLATAAASFVATHGKEIIQFFKDAVTFGRNAASTIGGLASAALGFWNSIPAGLRDLLVKGIVADRTVKFLFGISPIKIVASLAESALGGVGKQVAQSLTGTLLGGVQKVWVMNPGFGGGGGPGGGAAGAAEGAGAAELTGGGLGAGGGIGAIIATTITAVTAGAGLGAIMGAAGLWIIANSKDPLNVAGRQATATARGVTTPVPTTTGLPSDRYPLAAWLAKGSPVNISGDPTARDEASKTRAALAANLQPLPTNISHTLANHFQRVRDAVESTRIATVTRLGDVKSAVDVAKINQIAATRTGDAAVVSAIHAIKLAVTVPVKVTVTGGTITKTTGTTILRIGGNAARGALLDGATG